MGDLVLVMRTAPEMDVAVVRMGASPVTVAFAQAALALTVDGHPVASVQESPSDGWSEWVLRVPGTRIGSERAELTLAGRYASFAYWAYQ